MPNEPRQVLPMKQQGESLGVAHLSIALTKKANSPRNRYKRNPKQGALRLQLSSTGDTKDSRLVFKNYETS